MKRLVLLIILTTGCSPVAVETSKNPSCTTTIDGSFFCKSIWKGKSPAIIVGNGPEAQTIYGKLVEINKDGVTFDPDKQGLYDGPLKLYYFKDLRAAINDSGDVIYGRVSQAYEHEWKLTLEIVNLDEPKPKPVMVPLKINKRFSFCMEPGHYRISKFHFEGNRGSLLESLGPIVEFEVQEGKSNYLGEMYLNYPKREHTTLRLIPFKIIRKEGYSSGAAFGAIGGLLEEIYLESVKDAAGYNTMIVEYDTSLAEKRHVPLNISELQFRELK